MSLDILRCIFFLSGFVFGAAALISLVSGLIQCPVRELTSVSQWSVSCLATSQGFIVIRSQNTFQISPRRHPCFITGSGLRFSIRREVQHTKKFLKRESTGGLILKARRPNNKLSYTSFKQRKFNDRTFVLPNRNLAYRECR